MLSSQLLSLPPPLLLLISTTLAEHQPQWPYNLPTHQKYWPEHETLMKRDVHIRSQLVTQKPVGMRKMSDDPNEMFFLDYWQFELPPQDAETPSSEETERSEEPQRPDTQPTPSTLDRRRLALLSETSTGSNETQLSTPFLPPLLLHDDSSPSTNDLILPRDPSWLFKRDFACPANTTTCSSIGRPNSCCGASETCTLISDTGIGDVGCCPQGQKCSGSIGTCDTSQGYTSCPGSPNGGCCIPGFTCSGIGCVAGGGSSVTTTFAVVTVTGTVTPGSSTVTSTTTPPPPSSTSSTEASIETTTSTIIPPPITPSTTTVYTTLPPSTDTAIVTAATVAVSTPEQGTLTCSPGFNTCAPSLGGGCCPSDRACGTGGFCPPLSTSTSAATSAAAAPPIRPTSDTDTSPSPPVSSQGMIITTSATESLCPTGYYMCSAFYIPGCCRVGRNCDTTDCPATATNTIVSNGATIVVPGAGSPTTINSLSSDSNPERTQGNPTVTATATSTGTSTGTGGQGGAGSCAQGFFNCAASDGGGCCPSGYTCGAMCTAAPETGGPGSVGKAPVSGASREWGGEVWRWGWMGAAVVAGGCAFVL